MCIEMDGEVDRAEEQPRVSRYERKLSDITANRSRDK